jgi:hypothetical protein
MQTLRDILEEHPAGISRAGLLAWAQLRIDPTYDAARLETDLAALGTEVAEQDGFLKLGGAPTTTMPEPDAASSPGAWASSWSGPQAPPEPSAGGGWIPPDSSATGWTPPAAGAAGASAGWIPPHGSPTAGADAGSGSWPDGGWVGPDGGGTTPVVDGAWVAPPDLRSRRRMVVIAVVAGLVAVGIVIVTMLASIGSMVDELDDALATPGPGGTVGDAMEMGVGDCIDIPGGDEFTDVTYHACTELHDAEVFWVDTVSGEVYPTDAGFETWVDENCTPAFAAYTGSALDEQDLLDVWYFTPTKIGWKEGDHEVVCILGHLDGSQADQSYLGANP